MHETTRRLFEAARELRGEETLTGVAALIGTTPQRLKNWETRGMSQEGILDAAQRLGIDAGWIRSGVGQMRHQKQNVSSAVIRSTVPLISWVQAGSLSEVQDVFLPGEADEWVDTYDSKVSGGSFALRVEGDSMVSQIPGDLSFPEGTVLVIDPDRGVQAGDFVIAKDTHTQKATFKKLAYDGGRWFLKPLNQTYPTIEIDDPDLRIIGKVVEFSLRGKLP
jgi:SOS-response transcriptional repressor LexA